MQHPVRLVLLLAVAATAVGMCASPASARVPTGTVPVAIGTPTIYGALRAGSTLFVTSGTWAGSPASYRYTWVRCDRTGSSCSPPVGGLNRYLVPPSAVGSTLKVTVTGWNVRGTGSTSVLSGVVDAVAPLNLASPSVSGKTAVGGTLTVAPGRWSGSLPQTVTYEWRMGFVINNTYVWKPGVTTGRTYVVPKDSEGARFEVFVTVSNAAGSSSAHTILTNPIAGVAPVNTIAPTLTGGLAAGTMLSLTTGTWTGSPTSWVNAWARCDRNGNACVSLPPNGQGSGHLLLFDDIGHTLRATVTVGNLLGTRSASVLSGIVTGLAPHNDRAPNIEGIAQVGSILTAYRGDWSGGAPLGFPYDWQSSADGVVWTSLARPGPTFAVPLRLVGYRVRVVVTVSNAAGSATGISAATDPIAAGPGLLGAPTLTVTRPVAAGSVVAATPGSWGAHPTCTYAYRWESSTDAAHWVPVAGAVTDRLTLAASLLGGYVRVVVTATDSARSTTATSVPLAAR